MKKAPAHLRGAVGEELGGEDRRAGGEGGRRRVDADAGGRDDRALEGAARVGAAHGDEVPV